MLQIFISVWKVSKSDSLVDTGWCCHFIGRWKPVRVRYLAAQRSYTCLVQLCFHFLKGWVKWRSDCHWSELWMSWFIITDFSAQNGATFCPRQKKSPNKGQACVFRSLVSLCAKENNWDTENKTFPSRPYTAWVGSFFTPITLKWLNRMSECCRSPILPLWQLNPAFNLINAKLLPASRLPWERSCDCPLHPRDLITVSYKRHLIAFTGWE